ncbi:MAG: molybdopterin cofactor-binding domain-containing protein [Pseudomonadales bacterium]
MTNLTRRMLLKSSVTAAGGMLLGFHLPVFANATPYQTETLSNGELNAWLRIDPDNTITIRVAKAEMGQGVMTALPMILADELEVDWNDVTVEYADPANSAYGSMATSGSRAVRESRPILQQAGAEAREKLIKAAAESWLVPVEEVYADFGKIIHKPTRRSFRYGELAAKAAEISVANVKIKQPRDFTLIGLPTPRIDTPAKVDGSAKFGMDVRVEGMVYAAVKHCPVLGGKLRGYRFNAVRGMPGVIAAVRLETGVAIVAESFWQASQAVEQLPVQWDIGEEEKSYSEKMRQDFAEALPNPGVMLRQDAGTEAALETSENIIESDYLVPYLSHACMEPMNCTARVHPDGIDIWAGVQNPHKVISDVAALMGKPEREIQVHNCYLGGGFGRRSHTDYVLEAVTIAQEVGLPVQMIWSREDDMRGGRYRPMAAARFKVGLDLDNNVVAYTNHSVAHSILLDRDGELADGTDSNSVQGLIDMPYEFAPQEISHTVKNTHVPTWWWRSVSHSQNAFALECFIDELATTTKMDPFAFRRKYLRNKPRWIEVLNELEDKSNWKRRPGGGKARGVAIHECFGTIVAQVAEVSITPNGGAQVHKIISVVDCGNLINPAIAKAQVESSVLYGLSATLYGKVTIERGVVLEDNFDTYRVMEMADTPEMETHFFLAEEENWGGLGEPAVPPVAPAVVNALYQLTRRRIRSLPVSDFYLQRG